LYFFNIIFVFNNETVIDPTTWDDGTGAPLATVSPGNRWTVKRIYFFGQTEIIGITEGQALYNSADEAEASIFLEEPVLSPLITLGAFVTALITQGTTTDLSDPSKARFVNPEFAVGSSGGGVGDMTQAVYDTAGVMQQLVGISASQILTNKEITNLNETTQILIDATNIEFDHNLGKFSNVTLTASRIMDYPTNVKGGVFSIRFIQNGTGGHVITWGANYLFPGGVKPIINPSPNSVSTVTFINYGGATSEGVSNYAFS